MYGVKYEVFRLDDELCRKLNFNKGFPTSFILDRAGIIRYFRAGGTTDEDGAEEDIMEIYYPKLLEQLKL